jgi:hypothetical protein
MRQSRCGADLLWNGSIVAARRNAARHRPAAPAEAGRDRADCIRRERERDRERGKKLANSKKNDGKKTNPKKSDIKTALAFLLFSLLELRGLILYTMDKPGFNAEGEVGRWLMC